MMTFATTGVKQGRRRVPARRRPDHQGRHPSRGDRGRADGIVTDPFGNIRAGFEGEAEISRKDFGLTWNVALDAGGVLVSDKIKIQLDVSAIKAA